MPPAIPIIAAVGSIAAGAAAIGTATTLLGTIAAGAMMVGGALSLAGTVSGNEKLSKWGGIISAVGGVGAIANGIATSVGSQLAGEGAGLAAETGAATAGEATVSDVAQQAAASAGGTGEVASSMIDPSAAALAGEGGTTTGLLNEAAGSGLASEAASAGGLAADAGTASGFGGAGSDLAVGGLGAEGLGTVGSAGAGAGGASSSPLSNISSWIKNNKELVDVGGGFLKGAMSSGEKKEELLAYLREKEAAENRAKASYSASVTGAAGLPFRVNPSAQVKMGTPVNPTRYQTTPQIQPPQLPQAAPQAPGFLNTAMQGR